MGDFQILDILILAGVAGFLIYRLYHVLGEDDGVRPKDKNTNNVVSLASKKKSSSFGHPVYIIDGEPSKERGRIDPFFEKIKAVEPDFDGENFIAGCEKAFEFIIEAFAQGDKETLNRLLGPQLFKHFSAAIDTRYKKKERLEQSIEKMNGIKIENVEIKSQDIFITVLFESEQIIVLYDEDNQIIQGKEDQAELHRDLWTFYRKARSPSPIWQLVATKTAGLA